MATYVGLVKAPRGADSGSAALLFGLKTTKRMRAATTTAAAMMIMRRVESMPPPPPPLLALASMGAEVVGANVMGANVGLVDGETVGFATATIGDENVCVCVHDQWHLSVF